MLIDSDDPLFIRLNDYLERIETAIRKGQQAKRIASGLNDEEDRHLALESGVGKALHDVYSGYEKIFEEIADEVDGGKPTDSSWHVSLLTQLTSSPP